MGIELGLARIAKLTGGQTRSWRHIHVAGTNGKGSVCAYISSCLHAAGIKVGRFTSPYLVDRWDSVSLEENVVDETQFLAAEATVKELNDSLEVGATEFEILTATAFKLFSKHGVDVAVVETGLGGRLDATNVLPDPLVTVITRIGFDHQNYLGSTILEIAKEKGGIFKAGVPCVVDGTNESQVLRLLRDVSEEKDASSFTEAVVTKPSGILPRTYTPSLGDIQLDVGLNGSYQLANAACAANAMALLHSKYPQIDRQVIEAGLRETQWPGRLHWVHITSQRKTLRMLVDGAHNIQSASELSEFVTKSARQPGEGVTWILAFSQGKDFQGILKVLLQPGDSVLGTQFGPVKDMPWVLPVAPEEICAAASATLNGRGSFRSYKSFTEALQAINSRDNIGLVVAAGSLYLVSDIFREMRQIR